MLECRVVWGFVSNYELIFSPSLSDVRSSIAITLHIAHAQETGLSIITARLYILAHRSGSFLLACIRNVVSCHRRYNGP